jgi:hypothetical protein
MKHSFILAILVLFSFSVTHSQLGNILKNTAAKTVKNTVNTPDFLENHPITTSLTDAKWEAQLDDAFLNNLTPRKLTSLQRTSTGGFVLQQGYYEMHDQSYCLKAGTHGPGGGDGYLYAPTMGPADDAILSILHNSVQQPEIPQRDIQMLLWAIIARSKFEELQTRLKLTAALLLTKEQLAKLNRTALNFLPEPAMNKLKASAPPAVQAVLEAENSLRQMLSSPSASYAEMEQIAVLAGMVGLGPGSKEVPSGKWSLHPDGYYIRYLPNGYTNTVVQIWVPENAAAIGKEYDPATHIAVPGNTARQRLVQSGREYQK